MNGLRSKNPTYWERLDTLFGPVIDHWLRCAGIRGANGFDVRQEILLAVSRNIDQYQHNESKHGSLRRWMWGIARHKIADARRADMNHALAVGGSKAQAKMAALPALPFEDSDSDSLSAVRKQLVVRAVKILERDFKPQTWKAFWLTVVDEVSCVVTAEQLGISSGAVRQAKFRVLSRLRDELSGEFPETMKPSAELE